MIDQESRAVLQFGKIQKEEQEDEEDLGPRYYGGNARRIVRWAECRLYSRWQQ